MSTARRPTSCRDTCLGDLRLTPPACRTRKTPSLRYKYLLTQSGGCAWLVTHLYLAGLPYLARWPQSNVNKAMCWPRWRYAGRCRFPATETTANWDVLSDWVDHTTSGLSENGSEIVQHPSQFIHTTRAIWLGFVSLNRQNVNITTTKFPNTAFCQMNANAWINAPQNFWWNNPLKIAEKTLEYSPGPLEFTRVPVNAQGLFIWWNTVCFVSQVHHYLGSYGVGTVLFKNSDEISRHSSTFRGHT